MSDDERKAYAKGYNAGSRGRWPEHKPPLPPHEITQNIVVAAGELRDTLEGKWLATFEANDEMVLDLDPKIEVRYQGCKARAGTQARPAVGLLHERMAAMAKPVKPGSVQAMLDKVRKAMSECTAPEKECYEALCSEADGWRMRLDEIEAEEQDGER